MSFWIKINWVHQSTRLGVLNDLKKQRLQHNDGFIEKTQCNSAWRMPSFQHERRAPVINLKNIRNSLQKTTSSEIIIISLEISPKVWVRIKQNRLQDIET